MTALSPRRVLLPLGLAVCLSLFGDLTLFAVLVSQLDVLGLTLASTGVMLGIHRLIRIPGNPLAGWLVDRWGRRSLFVGGMVLAVASTAGYGLVRGFWPFLLARIGWGLAWMLLNVAGLAMVVDVSTRENRGRWMGVYNAFVVAGLALGPLVGGFLVDWTGFRPGILACAGISLVGLAIAAIALPETRRPRPAHPQGSTSGSPSLTGEWSRVLSRLRSHSSLIRPLALYLIVQFTGEGVVLSTITLLLQQRFGAQVSLGGLALGVASAGGLMLGMRSLLAGVSGPLAGHLSDGRTGRSRVIAGGLAAGLAGFVLLAAAPSIGLIALGIALGAAGSGAVLSSLAALVGDLSRPGREGALMGVYSTAGDLGSAAAPFLAFGLVQSVRLEWIYVVCAVAFLAGLCLLWPERRLSAA